MTTSEHTAPDSAATTAVDSTRRERRPTRFLPAHPLGSGFVVALGVILAVGLAAAVASISTVLISVFLGLFLALGMDPAVRAMERRGVQRWVGVAIVAVSFLVIVVVILVVLVPVTVRQFAEAVQAAPAAIAAIQSSDQYAAFEDLLGVDLGAAVHDSIRSLTNISSFLAVSGGLLRAGIGLVGAISSAVIVVVLTLYFLAAMRTMKNAAAGLIPAYRRTRFVGLLDEITSSVGAVVAGGITLSTINAAVVFVLQLAIGSSVPAVMAIVAFFVTLVPLIGSLVFLLIGTTGALFISPTAALIFAIGYLIYIQIEAYVITPRVMGRAVAVPGVLVIIGAMIGATLMGLLGALIAIPITASILIIIRQVIIPRQNAQTLAPD